MANTLATLPLTTVPRPLHAHPVGTLPAVQSLLYVLVIALFLMTFTVQPIRIPSASMEPTLLVGDFLLLDKASVASEPGPLLPRTTIARGDVVVFHDPVEDPSLHLVKRVIGLPGDRIHLRDGVVYLNERPLKEDYAVYRASAPDGYRDNFPTLATLDARVNAAWWIQLRSLVSNGDLQVPARSYFVMGDNRNDSEDSRYWGFVPRDAIIGKPALIYFSYREPQIDGIPASIRAENGRPSAGSAWHDAESKQFLRWDRILRIVH